MIEGTVIILAGGKSSRMGHPKGLVNYRGRPWIEEQLAQLAKCGLQDVVIVLGYQAENYFAALPWLTEARGEGGDGGEGRKGGIGYSFRARQASLTQAPNARDVAVPDLPAVHVRCIVNQHPALGPFSTIQAGARIGGRAQSAAHYSLDHPWWVLPIDVPCPSAETWRLIAQSRARATVPTYGGRGGHPVRLSADFMRSIIAQPADAPDSRLDHQIRLHAPDTERVDVEDACILLNMNTPGDWPPAQLGCK